MLLLAAAALAGGGGTGHSQSAYVRAQLVADVQTIQPGRPFWAAVRFEIEKDWHVNWINPGDAGLAPSITWKLPDGFEVGELLWPAPHRYQIGPLVIYGYDGELLLMARLTPPENLQAGTKVKMSADVDWLACAEACVPGEAEVKLALPVQNEHPEPNAKWTAALEKTRLEQPQPLANWAVQAFVEDEERYGLEVRSFGDAGISIGGCEFYPLQPDFIEHAAVQYFTSRSRGFDLALKRAQMSLEIPERLTGVLVINSLGGERLALSVDVPFERR